jgi:cytochrome P450
MSLSSLPSAPGASLVGHAHLLRDDRLSFLSGLARTGPLVKLRFLTREIVMGTTPQAAHDILVEKGRSFEKSPGIRLLLYYLAGDGLFTSEGELWRRQRRLMAPLFQPAQIGQYAEVMRAVTRRALGAWRDGETVDLAREMTRITMGVVGKALFDADTFDEADELGEVLTVALAWTNQHSASSRLVVQLGLLAALEKSRERVPEALRDYNDRLYDFLKEPVLLSGARSPELQGAVRRLDRRIQQMIDERRASGLKRHDLLTRLLTARDTEGGSGEVMTDKQVRDEAVTLFVAGHETTATALAWALYLLGRDAGVRERVQAEVDALGDEEPGFENAHRLALTTRVFKEAMRIYPPVIVLPRRALEDVEVCGHTIPAGTIVFVSPYGIHHHPDVYPDPERFDPDRFLPENEAKRHRSAYLPFGAGPRVCLGIHFAMLEGPLVLATLMRHVRFETDPGRVVEPENFTTLRPAGGVSAVVRLRRDRGDGERGSEV